MSEAYRQAIPVALRERIAGHVDRSEARGYPPSTLADERAYLVYSTDALFAYYLAEDGAVYELDMDSSRSAYLVTSERTIREVYTRAAADDPALAGLLEVGIVERVSPEVALLEGFHAGVHPWDRKTETREQAIRRHLLYFAERIEEPGPAYVVQRIPGDAFAELHLVGEELQLHANHRVETIVRGDVLKALRSAELPATIMAVERMLTN